MMWDFSWMADWPSYRQWAEAYESRKGVPAPSYLGWVARGRPSHFCRVRIDGDAPQPVIAPPLRDD